MAVTAWLAGNWFDLLQTVGIVGSLLFTAYTVRRDEKARKVGNLIAIKQEHREIWKDLYDNPELTRVLEKRVDLDKKPISDAESLFVRSLILHLSTVFRAMRENMFVPLEGLGGDIREFFSLPIPREVWKKYRRFQNGDFVRFVEKNQANP